MQTVADAVQAFRLENIGSCKDIEGWSHYIYYCQLRLFFTQSATLQYYARQPREHSINHLMHCKITKRRFCLCQKVSAIQVTYNRTVICGRLIKTYSDKKQFLPYNVHHYTAPSDITVPTLLCPFLKRVISRVISSFVS